MTIRSNILLRLADGNFHSGTELGNQLGVSRMAVNKGIHGLRELGIAIHSVHGKGYRANTDIQVFQADQIARQLSAAQKSRLDCIEILEKIDSTNDYLKGQLSSAHSKVKICLAEYQTEGRGRRGRQWVASPFRDLILSIAWTFESGPAAITGLSLAAAVAVVQALESCGVSGCGIKWPNDIFWQNRKLGGVLVDIHGEISGPCQSVIGLGLNIGLQDQSGENIGQPWVRVNDIVPQPLDRNMLAGRIITSLLDMLEKFESAGLSPFRSEWERLHLYNGRRVEIRDSTFSGIGIVQGIDASGALLVKGEQGKIRRCISGEVSLYPS